MRLLLHWVLSALAVWIVAHIVPGIYVTGPGAALIAGDHGHAHSVAVFAAIGASDQRFENLLRRQSNLECNRFRGEVVGIHFVFAQLVTDSQPIKQAGRVRFRWHDFWGRSW